jgi:nucleoside-diphosphate-sugar epimerase
VLLRDFHGKHAMYDVTKAKRELGFAPRPARDVLADTLRWLESRGVLPARSVAQTA